MKAHPPTSDDIPTAPKKEVGASVWNVKTILPHGRRSKEPPPLSLDILTIAIAVMFMLAVLIR